MKITQIFYIYLLLQFSTGCISNVTLKHKVEPIHITVDINVKVQEDLNDFFEFEDDIEGNEGKEKKENQE